MARSDPPDASLDPVEQELQPDPRVPPAVRIAIGHQEEIERLVDRELGRGTAPGCVVVLGRRDGVLYRRAFGVRTVDPAKSPMLETTVFDLASLTKPIATTTSLAVLAERGQLSFDDPLSRHVPELAGKRKRDATIRHALMHTAGFAAANPLSDYSAGPEAGLRAIWRMPLQSAPGRTTRYSDLGFIALGEVVRRVASVDLATFSRDHVFTPLGMSSTTFQPGPALAVRAAPTGRRDGSWMTGVVHDPRAHALGGVAGHAGLFSTGDDLARFARMMLSEGQLEGVRVLRAETVRQLVAPTAPRKRGLGWQRNVAGFSASSYGHTGFTGTALWLDPERDLFVAFLSNRHHPNGKGNVHPLVRQVRQAAVRALATAEPVRPGTAVLGIDALRRDGFARIEGARVGLITNLTGRARDGRRTADVIDRAPNVRLVALFAPEHGLGANRNGKVADAHDRRTGVPIYSLFGERDRPKPEQLRGIDTLVFDVQDIGTRFYTYLSTLHRALEVAANRRLRFVVLDRPNPIGGDRVEGPLIDAGRESFVNHHRVPLRHGLTAGEMARLIVGERRLDVDLRIIAVERWRREQYFDETGLPWVNPSPNIRSLEAAELYPALGPFEMTNVSVGRGTPNPFSVIGAPWMDGSGLVARLGELDGLSIEAASFTPQSSVHAGRQCRGIRLKVTDRALFRPARVAMQLAAALRDAHPRAWSRGKMDVLLANAKLARLLAGGAPAEEIEAAWQPGLREFLEIRAKYLLY